MQARVRGVLLSAVLLPVGSSLAVTYEVGTGKPYASIQAAVDAAFAAETTGGYAGPAPTILIHSGTYNEQVEIPYDPSFNDTQLSIYDGWQIKAAPNANVKIKGSLIMGYSRENFLIEGLVIDNGGAPLAGLNFNGPSARGNTVRNCVVYGIASSNAAVRGNFSYGANKLENVTLFNTDYGITANTDAYFLVKNTIVANNVHRGIFSTAGSPSSVAYSDFFNNSANYEGSIVDTGGNLNYPVGVDPLFVSTDPANPYFLWLRPDSPCVGTGENGANMGGRPVFEPLWGVNSGGTWSVGSNWTAGFVPNAVGMSATLGNVITSAATLSLDSTVTLGKLKFDSAQAYSIAGTATLQMQRSSGTAEIQLASGNHAINAPLLLQSNTRIYGSGTLTTGGITNSAALAVENQLVAGPIDGSGALTVASGAKVSASHFRLDSLTVNGNAAITGARSSAGTSKLTTLTLGTGAQLDLGSNDLVVDSSGTPLSAVRSMIISGYAAGSWNDSGIVSSAAIGSSNPRTALGYASNAALGLSTFNGVSVTGTSVLVRYTAVGDANLDGTVSSTDFSALTGGYGLTANANWNQGDFNYDGRVNTLDFNLLAGSFGQTIAAPSLGSVVPEPVLFAVAPLAFMMLRRRSR